MAFSKSQIKYLKKLAHHLNPVVLVGQHGVTNAVIHELEQALVAHELIKVKLLSADKQGRDVLISQLVEHSGADLVGVIGRMAILYKPGKDNKILLPSS